MVPNRFDNFKVALKFRAASLGPKLSSLVTCLVYFILTDHWITYTGVTLKGLKESHKRQGQSPPVKSRGSKRIPLLSKRHLREESRCV